MIKRNTTIILLLTATFCVNGHTIPQLSYNLEPEKTQNEEELIRKHTIVIGKACVNKAVYGEKLVLKKINGKPLQDVLKEILDTHSKARQEGKHLPWYLVLEKQRLARDAYRSKYNDTEDIDEFVFSLYHSCLNNGF